jgi:hypothetical protein
LTTVRSLGIRDRPQNRANNESLASGIQAVQGHRDSGRKASLIRADKMEGDINLAPLRAGSIPIRIRRRITNLDLRVIIFVALGKLDLGGV